jgi:hypothetical protein
MKQAQFEKDLNKMDSNGTEFGRRSAKELEARTVDILKTSTTHENEIKNLKETAERTFKMMEDMNRKIDFITERI